MFTNTSFHLTCWSLPRPLRHYWLTVTVVSCKTSHGKEGAFAKSGQCEDPARMPPAHQTSVNLHYQISGFFPEPRNRHRTAFQFKKLSFNLSEYFLWIIDLDFTFLEYLGGSDHQAGVLTTGTAAQPAKWLKMFLPMSPRPAMAMVKAMTLSGVLPASPSRPIYKWIQNQITKAKNGII